jgi:hypothetical protein
MSHQAGGRTRVTIDGVSYIPRTAPVIRPARQENTVYPNHDQSVGFGTMNKPATAEFTFDVGPKEIDRFNEAFMRDFHNVTVLEIDRGVLHQFSNAKVIGEPAINFETGEVSGLSISTDAYLRTKQ